MEAAFTFKVESTAIVICGYFLSRRTENIAFLYRKRHTLSKLRVQQLSFVGIFLSRRTENIVLIVCINQNIYKGYIIIFVLFLGNIKNWHFLADVSLDVYIINIMSENKSIILGILGFFNAIFRIGHGEVTESRAQKRFYRHTVFLYINVTQLVVKCIYIYIYICVCVCVCVCVQTCIN